MIKKITIKKIDTTKLDIKIKWKEWKKKTNQSRKWLKTTTIKRICSN
jgi:hypothetical protein